MSGGLLLQGALRQIRERRLPEPAEADLVSALEAADDGPLDFAYLAGADAGLARGELLVRGVAVLFCFAAANLADDIADGDCDYLPPRAAPGAQFLLQSLYYQALIASTVPREDIAAAIEELVQGAGQQQREVRTTRWTLDVARDVAFGIAARQYASHLRILWAGTPLAPRAAAIGADLGVVSHVSVDLSSKDPRITTLSDPERREMVAWAREAVARLKAVELHSIRAALATLEPRLAQEP